MLVRMKNRHVIGWYFSISLCHSYHGPNKGADPVLERSHVIMYILKIYIINTVFEITT